MKRTSLFIIILVLLIMSAGICRAEGPAGTPEYSDFTQLSGKTVSMLTGAPFEELVRSKVPDVGGFTFFNNMADIILALKQKKTDACLSNNAIAQLSVNRDAEVALFPLNLQDGAFGFAFAKGDPNRDLWQSAYEKIGADTVQAVWEKWTGADESVKTLPKQDWPGRNGTVKAAVCDTLEPMSYAGKNGELMGFDVEMILLMAKELDVHVEFTGMEFSAILAFVQSGKALLGAGSIIITEEREEAVDFVSYYPAAFVLVVRSVKDQNAAAAAGASLDDLDGKRIGVQTGTNFDEMVQNRLPNAQVMYFNNKADLINALMTDKIDGYVIDEPVIVLEMKENDKLTYIPEYLETYDFAYILPKNEMGEKLRKEFNAYLSKTGSDGRLAELQKKWLSGDKSLWTIADYTSFPGPNGTIRLATEPLYEPFGFIYNNVVMGYEVDVVVQFCEEYGYRLEIVNMNYDSILPAVQTAKADMGAGGITVTLERAESVLFSDPYFHGGTVMVILKEDPSAASVQLPSGQSSLEKGLEGIKASFIKTFIREDRWKLFLNGIMTTLLITILTIIFGTVLGFLLFMLCRNGNPAANAAAGICIWLVQGMPMVVLLMVLYYVIFGSSAISGTAVAVVGFTLTFSASVFGLLRMGVGTIDAGQYEAAYALGFSNLKTFYRIILPQAVPHIMPGYSGEIISLLKATAVVGYVAVQDLTKMGDIVRSRTYEAFFPLIAVTVIYFLLEAIFGYVIGRIRIKLDPKKRNLNNILKGVKNHD